jgi:hypothetical protein
MDVTIPAAGSAVVTESAPVEAAVIELTPIGETIVLEPATAELPYAAPLGDVVARESGLSTPLPGAMPALAAMTYDTPVGVSTSLPDAMPAVAAMTYDAPVGVSTSLPDAVPVVAAVNDEAPVGVSAGLAPLLSGDEANHFRTRWNEIQGSFVDEPRSAVQQADALVSEAVEQITQVFASERSALENQWKQSNEVSTEDLRKALQRYRSFFNRLVV